MAVSARTQALLEVRKATAALRQFAGARKVLSPYGSLSSEASTIARKNLSAEIEAKERLYKDGQLSNEEMRAYYQGLRTNSLLTPLERVGIEDNLRDFDDRVRLSALEAAYTGSPDNSLARVQATSALANYYQTKASRMVPGTPAYSLATEEAGRWNNMVATETSQVQKLARSQKRSQLEYETALLPHNSSERAYAKAQAFMELYNMAATDGDTLGAQRLLTQAQEQQTLANELATREAEAETKGTMQAEKTDIRNILGQLTNDYHDGRIDERQYLQALADIAPRIDATNDYGLINTLNRTTDIVQKNLEKGGLRRTTTASGLPAVLGKVKGAGGGAYTSWDKQDFDYSDDLRLAKGMFDAGSWDVQKYLTEVAIAVVSHAEEVNKRIETVYAIASQNPNTKITYNGRKQRAEDILNNLYEEQTSLEEQAGAVESGNFTLLEIAPTEGTELGKGKSVATYRLVNPETFEPGMVVADDKGILHKLTQERVYLSPEEAKNVKGGAMGFAYYTSPKDKKAYQIRTDESGRMYYEPFGAQKYRVYWADSPKFEEFNYEPDKPAKSRETIQTEAETVYGEAAKAREVEAKKVITPSVEEPTLLEKIFRPKAVSPAIPTWKEQQLKITEPIKIVQPPAQPLVVSPVTPRKEVVAAQGAAERLKLPGAIPPAPSGFQKIELGQEYAPPISLPKEIKAAPQQPLLKAGEFKTLPQLPGGKVQLGAQYGPEDLIKKQQQRQSLAQRIWPTIKSWFRR